MFLSLFLMACGDKSGDTGSDLGSTDAEVSSFDCAQDYALCTELSVPEGFTGETRNLTLALYSELPPVGPPDVVLVQIENPEIGVDKNFSVELHPITASGDYHLYISLYMEGGGEWLPESGIDYYLTTDPITFDGGAVDLGGLELILAE